MLTRRPFPALLAALSLAACGGSVIVSPDGGGGTTTTTTSTATLTGPHCTDGDPCPGGEICIFTSGVCGLSCTHGQPWTMEPCPAGLVCTACATGSCLGCEDCVDACLPASAGKCDDHDDCAAGEVCLYESGTCAPGCGEPGQPECPAGLTCAQWATAACPICQQAIGACLPP
jgi:hypothetical protein